MYKEFLEYDTVRNNAFILGKKIFESGFIPDIIVNSLRGGAPMANVLSEYLNLACEKYGKKKPSYAAVVAKSYSGVKTHGEVEINGWTINIKNLPKDTKFILAEDIYDSGNTINTIVDSMLKLGFKRENILVVVHDYKIFTNKPHLPIIPDMYCRKHEIKTPDDDIWIHYMSHELKGLSLEEAEKNYFSKFPETEDALRFIL